VRFDRFLKKCRIDFLRENKWFPAIILARMGDNRGNDELLGVDCPVIVANDWDRLSKNLPRMTRPSNWMTDARCVVGTELLLGTTGSTAGISNDMT
jgi:hypothetical protein